MKTIFTMAICLTLCFNLTAQEHAKMMRAHELWVAPWELRGKNQVVAVFEYGYALASHKEFYKNRVTVPNKPVDILPNWHTVGTTGVICARGVDPKVKGVVYESKVQSYYIADGDSQAELLKKYFPIERWAVTNHSYSKRFGWHLRQDGIWQWTGFLPTAQHPDPFGAYLEESRLFDSVVHANNYVIPVVTAGNQRGQVPSPNQYVYYFIPGSEQTTVYYTGGPNDPPKNGGAKGYDCLPPTAVAKNVITVGCVDAAKKLSTFSQTGPTNDGRVKPDVVTLGEGVLIAGDRVNVNGYSSADGTSFAAPAIAGVIVQLRELFKKYFVTEMLPSTAKALLIHTAEDLGNKGPDYQYGWGLPDAKKAALLLNTANNDGVFAVQEFRLMQNVQQHFLVKPQGAGVPIKVTIAWTDPPGIVTEGGPTKSAYKTDPTPKLVHDIDLWVDKIVNGKSVEVYRPWVLDRTVPEKAATRGRNSVDNVEQVIIDNPDPNALYRVNVTHAGPFKTPEQLFSRCISGADLYLEPPTPVSASIQNNVEKSGETTQAFNAMVSWPRILQATSYEVRYRKSGTNAWTVKNGISNNSTVLTGLELGTYQIQVRARRGPKVSTYATITKTFTITPKPPTNLLSGPITASTCKVSWTGDGNATGYRVFHARIDKDGKLLDNGWKTSTTTSTSAVLSGLLQDQRYAWSVQSTYPNDVKSESAATAGFKTSTDCNAYEPNNAIAEAKPVEKGRTIYARACKDDVSDWYSFSVSSQQPNLKVVMYAQPVPLQMALYRMENGSAVKVKDSPDNNNGTGTKVVEANGLQGGSYYLRIFNVNSGSVFSSATPYSFVVTTK